MQTNVLSVRQLNLYVRSLLEGDPRLSHVTVQGEVSNFKNHYASGHLYFSLKDNDASIRCVMFRSFAAGLKYNIEDGMQVILRGRVSVYEKDGQYQFYAEDIYPCGEGDIALGFRQIKEKLEKEGMLDPANKRPLPQFPQRIAVVTSDTGAAVKDILNILSRRWPLCQVILCPVAVQGDSAVSDMTAALDRLYSLSSTDVIIIGRGGGSAEDLWAFNSELLARKIYESPVPVISAVGHETDFTICDFVADLRAPTPSAAAELAVPDKDEILNSLKKRESLLKNLLTSKYALCKSGLDACLNSAVFKKPQDFLIDRRTVLIDKLYDKLTVLADIKYKNSAQVFSSYVAELEALSPLKVLSRGYAAVQKNGTAVTSVENVNAGEELTLTLKDGKINALVKATVGNDNDV